MQAVAPFIQMDPNVMDNFNGDELSRIIARIYGFPQRGLHSQESMQETRDSRAQAQQAQLQAQQQTQAIDNTAKIAPAVAQLQQAS